MGLLFALALLAAVALLGAHAQPDAALQECVCRLPVAAQAAPGARAHSARPRVTESSPPAVVAATVTPPSSMPRASFPRRQLKAQADCVATPAEFKAAFEARQARCVSPDLVGRVISARSVDKLGDDTEQKLVRAQWLASGASRAAA